MIKKRSKKILRTLSNTTEIVNGNLNGDRLNFFESMIAYGEA